MPDDPVCFFLRESVKEGAKERFHKLGLESLWIATQEIRPNAIEKHGRIRRELERSKTTSSRLGLSKQETTDQ